MDLVLVPCPACDRHVRSTEAACPFCAALLPDDLASRAVPASPRRLGRAAAFAFGATVALAACGGNVVLDGASGSAGSTAGGTGGSTAGGTGGSGEATGGFAGGGATLYGGSFPPPDAGESSDGGNFGPPYGTPGG